MATAEHINNDDASFECDRCHSVSDPMGFAYIGPTDEGDTQCSPFMEWKQVCYNCATPEEMERWYGSN